MQPLGASVIGAHPGYPDREGFGRREQSLTTLEVIDLIKSQIDFAFEPGSGGRRYGALSKPHGALYNQAQREPDVARAVVAAARPVRLAAARAAGSCSRIRGARRGVVYVAEGFPDRRYRADGSLAPRSEPGALLA